jgi:hypothetical protein
MVEARVAERLRVNVNAQIVFNYGATSYECTIRNLSESGAKLILAKNLTLPEAFDLVVPSRRRTYCARLRWRIEDEIGVAFVSDKSTSLTERVALLESENQALRRQLAEARRERGVAVIDRVG